MPISGGSSLTPKAILDYYGANIFDIYFDALAYQVDDIPSMVTDGTATDPTWLTDNNVGTHANFLLNQYVDIHFEALTYIQEVRFRWFNLSDPANRYRLQAFVDGAWVDCLVDIVDLDVADWGAWLPLTTPRAAFEFRFECTTFNVAAEVAEMECRGEQIR